MAEPYRLRIATMFTANAELDLWPHAPSAFHCNGNHLADASRIDTHEWIAFDQAALHIFPKERACIVPRNAERCLRQVIGAETEELRDLRQLAGHQRRAR